MGRLRPTRGHPGGGRSGGAGGAARRLCSSLGLAPGAPRPPPGDWSCSSSRPPSAGSRDRGWVTARCAEPPGAQNPGIPHPGARGGLSLACLTSSPFAGPACPCAPPAPSALPARLSPTPRGNRGGGLSPTGLSTAVPFSPAPCPSHRTPAPPRSPFLAELPSQSLWGLPVLGL